MDTNKTASHFDLTGKVCVVTGGSRGLGLAMCQAFAAAGAALVIASRKQQACDDAARTITDEYDVPCLPLACHVADWAACDALLDEAYREFGQVDVLVNNAGMSPLYSSLSSVSRDLWDKVLDVNLGGPFRLCAVAAERMCAGNGGSIINISSIAAIAPGSAEIPYAAAKAGLNNLAQSMAHTFAPKVRCNAILPGPFLTDIADAWDENIRNAINAVVPMGRAGQPEEIIGIALYLASDASTYTNGALIKVDGGMAFG